MSEEHKTFGDAAVDSVKALEKMGASVREGIEAVTKDVKKVANSAISVATGAAAHAYPELVKRKHAEGMSSFVAAICAWIVTAIAVVVAVSLLLYGFNFAEDDVAGCLRGVGFFVCILTTIISFGIGASHLAEGWADAHAPEGKVISSLLYQFLNR